MEGKGMEPCTNPDDCKNRALQIYREYHIIWKKSWNLSYTDLYWLEKEKKGLPIENGCGFSPKEKNDNQKQENICNKWQQSVTRSFKHHPSSQSNKQYT